MKNFIAIVFIIAILVALGSAFIAMLRGGKENSDKMFKSLTIRVGLSLILFIILLLGKLGGIF